MKRIVAHLGALSRQLTQLDGNEFVLIDPDDSLSPPVWNFMYGSFSSALCSLSLSSPPPSVEYDRTG